MGCAANKQIKQDTNLTKQNNAEIIEVKSVFLLQINRCRSKSESKDSVKEKQMIPLKKRKVIKGSRFKEDIVYTSKSTTKDYVNKFQAQNCHQIDSINLEYKKRNYKKAYEFPPNDKQDFDCFESTSDFLSNIKAKLESGNFRISSGTESVSSGDFSDELRDGSLKSTNLSKCNSQLLNMSRIEESESDRSIKFSKIESPVRLTKIFDFSSKKDNKSEINTAKTCFNSPLLAKISFNSPLLAKIKVRKSKRVLENRPRLGSSTCRVSDKLSQFSQNGINAFTPKKKVFRESTPTKNYTEMTNYLTQDIQETQQADINSPSKSPIELDNFISSSQLVKRRTQNIHTNNFRINEIKKDEKTSQIRCNSQKIQKNDTSEKNTKNNFFNHSEQKSLDQSTKKIFFITKQKEQTNIGSLRFQKTKESSTKKILIKPMKKQDHSPKISNTFFKYATRGSGFTNPSHSISLSNFASDIFVVKGMKNVQPSLDLLVPKSDIIVQSTKKKSFRVLQIHNKCLLL